MIRDKGRFWVALALTGCLAIMLIGLAVVGTLAEARGVDLNIDAEISTLLATIGGAIVGSIGGYLGGSERGRHHPADTVVADTVTETVAEAPPGPAPDAQGDGMHPAEADPDPADYTDDTARWV